MSGRRWQLASVCTVGTAVALIASGAPATSYAPTTPRPAVSVDKAGVTKFPLSSRPNDASGLTKVGHKIYFEAITANFNTRLGRISPTGKLRTVGIAGVAYPFNSPVKSSDGSVHLAMQAKSAEGSVFLAALDPDTWKVKTETTSGISPLAGWQSAADDDGRVWMQGNVPGKGIGVVGAGLGRPKVVVRTNIGPISSETDFAINNPLKRGPDGRVWLLGGDGFGAGLRIASFGAKGKKVDVTPRRLGIGSLALTRGSGEMWTVAGRRGGHLVAVGVDPRGDVTRVRTDLLDECDVDAVRPTTDGNGGLWLTGSDVSCSRTSELLVARVRMNHGVSVTRETGLGILGDAASAIVPVDGGGVLVAGRSTAGTLSFALVDGPSVDTIPVNLDPWIDDGQARYPMVTDQDDGAWSQGVNAKGNLVVVHLDGTDVSTSGTGLEPTARELKVGPDGALWTQGLNGNGRLVLVKVRGNGAVKKYPTGLEPTRFTSKPVYDGKGHMWFQGQNASTGNLVLVRVPAG